MTTVPAPRLAFHGVSKFFVSSDGTRKAALAPVSFSVEPGEFVCVVGPSGCGKTTLLRLAAGLIEPDEGVVDREQYAGTVGYVAQEPVLYPWRTVYQNAALGLEAIGEVKDERLEGVRQELESYGLGDALNLLPHELSGGMKQRVAVVRTLVFRPSLILCDEPFSQVDFVTRLRLIAQFRFACRVLKSTVLFVTHNIEEAIFLGDRVVVLSGRPGRLAEPPLTVALGGMKIDPVAVRADGAFQALFNRIWGLLK